MVGLLGQRLLLHAVLLATCCAAADELQADDWLVGWAGEVHPVTLEVTNGSSSGTNGVSSSRRQRLTLSNGLSGVRRRRRDGSFRHDCAGPRRACGRSSGRR